MFPRTSYSLKSVSRYTTIRIKAPMSNSMISSSFLGKIIKRKSERDENFDYETKLSRTFLKFFGLWVYDTNSRWIHLFCNLQAAAFLTFFLLACNLPFMNALFKVWGSLILMSDNLVISISVLIVEVKFIIFWIKKKEVTSLFMQMHENWYQDQREIMLKYVKISNLISIAGITIVLINDILYHGVVFFGVLLRTETNLTDIPGYKLAIQGSYLYDITIGHRFILTRLSQVMFGVFGGFINTTVDMIFSVFILHICGQLENFAQDIKSIATVESYVFRTTLKFYVLKHENITEILSKLLTIECRFISAIEDIFNMTIFFFVLLFVIVFSVLALLLISVLLNDVDVSILQINFYIASLTYFIFLMFVYSWVGQCLIDHSERVHQALYDSDWCLLTPRETQQLLMVLIRSQKSLTITVGKFAPLTLENFLQLMKSCGGYVSFLLAMND